MLITIIVQSDDSAEYNESVVVRGCDNESNNVVKIVSSVIHPSPGHRRRSSVESWVSRGRSDSGGGDTDPR